MGLFALSLRCQPETLYLLQDTGGSGGFSAGGANTGGTSISSSGTTIDRGGSSTTGGSSTSGGQSTSGGTPSKGGSTSTAGAGAFGSGGMRQPPDGCLCWPQGCISCDADCPFPGPPDQRCFRCDSDADCEANGLACDEASHGCVAKCSSESSCPPGQHCFEGACVPCFVDAHCRDGYCGDHHLCVGCLVDDHCTGTLTKCLDRSACVECTSNEHCGSNLCNLKWHACVECNGEVSCPAVSRPQLGAGGGPNGDPFSTGGSFGFAGAGGGALNPPISLSCSDGTCHCFNSNDCANSGHGTVCIDAGRQESHCGCIFSTDCTAGNCATGNCHCANKHCIVN